MNLAEPTCRQCERQGLNFPDGTRACPKHTTPEWRERLTALDRRAQAIVPRGWPYGPNIDVQARIDLVDWAEPLGLKRSGTRCQELHWLRTGQCKKADCRSLGWMDHTTHWARNGKPALVLTQPYSTEERLRGLIGGLIDDSNLQVEIKPGWYGHGTTGIFVWHADVWRTLQEA